ncbi:DUF4269 domain-containing protein [Pseudochryseolinea flava]|uniref:DUF4269 domain-containing protein n=1 Tax=Pseudochryseolinea flava TaxID=2059302 RepID=A0A364Y511_9BACT|nr:DUF4269 domain-containing protein [Pseudochryseolinea flava]
MLHFHNLDYLRAGNPRQRQAYKVLQKYCVFELLREFDPFLAGTIPIEIDVDGSDLDVLCYWENKNLFISVLQKSFSMMPNFSLREIVLHQHQTVIANIDVDGFPIEIFGQDLPVSAQFGYRHMMVEYKLLKKYGDDFRKEVIQLKGLGMKTESAFAKILGLDGDPYAALLAL